jgi:CubicO group peptidase (beta-lactamase class C family)
MDDDPKPSIPELAPLADGGAGGHVRAERDPRGLGQRLSDTPETGSVQPVGHAVEAERVEHSLPCFSSGQFFPRRHTQPLKLGRPALDPPKVAGRDSRPRCAGKVTPQTRFNLASATKPIAATAVLALVAEGKLALDAPIGAALPDLPPGLRGLTAHQLLTHAAGMREFIRTSAFRKTPQRFASIGDYPELVLAQPAPEPPGLNRYSDDDYVLLAAAVERVSGKAFWEYARERVLDPAGMSSESLGGTPDWTERSGVICETDRRRARTGMNLERGGRHAARANPLGALVPGALDPPRGRQPV